MRVGAHTPGEAECAPAGVCASMRRPIGVFLRVLSCADCVHLCAENVWGDVLSACSRPGHGQLLSAWPLTAYAAGGLQAPRGLSGGVRSSFLLLVKATGLWLSRPHPITPRDTANTLHPSPEERRAGSSLARRSTTSPEDNSIPFGRPTTPGDLRRLDRPQRRAPQHHRGLSRPCRWPSHWKTGAIQAPWWPSRPLPTPVLRAPRTAVHGAALGQSSWDGQRPGGRRAAVVTSESTHSPPPPQQLAAHGLCELSRRVQPHIPWPLLGAPTPHPDWGRLSG